MAYEVVGDELNTNDTTPVTVVPAPAASEQHVVGVHSITLYNADSANMTFEFSKDDGSTNFIIERFTLAPNESWTNSSRIVLSTTSDSLELVLTGVVTTSQGDIAVSYGVKS